MATPVLLRFLQEASHPQLVRQHTHTSFAVHKFSTTEGTLTSYRCRLYAQRPPCYPSQTRELILNIVPGLQNIVFFSELALDHPAFVKFVARLYQVSIDFRPDITGLGRCNIGHNFIFIYAFYLSFFLGWLYWSSW